MIMERHFHTPTMEAVFWQRHWLNTRRKRGICLEESRDLPDRSGDGETPVQNAPQLVQVDENRPEAADDKECSPPDGGTDAADTGAADENRQNSSCRKR
ncbi:unnamed protein product, partial [Amoebophrya sp. A120]|eukprot:GSA120T00021056001.1